VFFRCRKKLRRPLKVVKDFQSLPITAYILERKLLRASPGMLVHTCGPSYSGGIGEPFEASLSKR
jgi:hypothetical protein